MNRLCIPCVFIHSPQNIEYLLRHYFPSLLKSYPFSIEGGGVDDYYHQQDNLTTFKWSRKTHQGFSKRFQHMVYELSRILWKNQIPSDLLEEFVQYLAPKPISMARDHFIRQEPVFFFGTRIKDKKIFHETITVAFHWKIENKLYYSTWGSGWRRKCCEKIGQEWKERPLLVLKELMEHFQTPHLGSNRWGKFEINSLVEAMIRTWGREKTSEHLYVLWNIHPHLLPQISDMLMKIYFAKTPNHLKHMNKVFRSCYSETFLRFRMF